MIHHKPSVIFQRVLDVFVPVAVIVSGWMAWEVFKQKKQNKGNQL